MFAIVNESLYGRKRKFSVTELIMDIVLILFVILIAFEIYFNAVYKGYYICHSSMSPTLTGAVNQEAPGGDYIYINIYAKPTYRDIVIVYDKGKGFEIIKRVAAFGGDTVKIVDGQLWLKKAGEEDFKEVSEPYVDPENNKPGITYYNFPEHTVAENCMFLLGDNRAVSDDSRNKDNGDYEMQYLKGVVPAWSLHMKGFTTDLHEFFKAKPNKENEQKPEEQIQ